MLNRVGSPKPAATQPLPGRSAQAGDRPGPSPNSTHPTGPAPPFEHADEPPQTDTRPDTNRLRSEERFARS